MNRVVDHFRAALEHRLAAVALSVAAAVFYAYWIVAKVSPEGTIDFYDYYVASHAFAAGDNAYTLSAEEFHAWAQRLHVPTHAFPYYYPPLVAVLVWPLTPLLPQTASVAWNALSAVAMIGAAVLLGRSSPYRFGPGLAVGTLLVFMPATRTLNLGQANGFLFLSLSAALFFASRAQWKRTGAALALGTLIKVIPLAHVALLGWQRRFAALSGTAGGLILGYLACVLLFGAHTLDGGAVGGVVDRVGDVLALNSVELSRWRGQEAVTPYRGNQALSGFVFRLFADRSQAMTMWAVSAASILLVTVLSCTTRPGSTRRLRLELALVTAAITLLMPYTFAHQFVVILIPLVVLLEMALADPTRRWMLVLLLPLAATASASSINALRVQDLIDAHFVLCVVCWLLLVVALHQMRRGDRV